MEEAAELANYLPLSFKTPKEQEYIEFPRNLHPCDEAQDQFGAGQGSLPHADRHRGTGVRGNLREISGQTTFNQNVHPKPRTSKPPCASHVTLRSRHDGQEPLPLAMTLPNTSELRRKWPLTSKPALKRRTGMPRSSPRRWATSLAPRAWHRSREMPGCPAKAFTRRSPASAARASTPSSKSSGRLGLKLHAEARHR